MISKLSLLLGASCLLLGSIVLSAQDNPSFIVEDQTVDAGTQVSLDLVLMNYDSILSTTFSLFWDTAKLELVEISNIAPGMGSLDDNFNLSMAGTGELRYLFVTSAVGGSGVTLPNETALFTITMDVVAEPTDEPQTTELTFGGLIEVVDVSETAIAANFEGATLTIRGVVGTDEASQLNELAAVVSPNPFSEDAQVSIETVQQEEVSWQLSHINGQLITQGSTLLLPGRQVLSIPKSYFKYTGTYLLTLQAGEKRLTRQLYFIENR